MPSTLMAFYEIIKIDPSLVDVLRVVNQAATSLGIFFFVIVVPFIGKDERMK